MLGDFISDLCKFPQPCIFYAHFAQYDWRYIVPYLLDNGFNIEVGMRTDRDVYEVRIILEDGQKIIMRDSSAIFAQSLKKFASSFCPEIPKLEIDIEHFNPHDPDHVKYAMRDVEILRIGMPRFNSLMRDNFGVGLSATAASSAIQAWQHTLDDDEYYKCREPGKIENFIRDAYYGGLVFLTDTKKHFLPETYDINSSYPATMLEHDMPVGRCVSTKNYLKNKLGIYKIRIKAPENLIIPIIPSRDGKGNMRWCSGEFDTCVTGAEIEFAVKHGYILIAIYEGLVWEKGVKPFTKFINSCREIRKLHKNQPLEIVAKLLQNSCYGKFATKRVRSRVFQATCDAEKIGAKPLDIDGRLFVVEEAGDDMACLPEWSTFITAYSRLRLLRAAYEHVGVENCIYGDTDSLTIKAGSKGTLDVGGEYGQFKHEKTWQQFRALAPKVYVGERMIDGELVWTGAAKGMTMKAMHAENWQELYNLGKTEVDYLSLPSLKVALSKGVQPATIKSRKSSNINNSKNYYLQDEKIMVKMAS